MNKQAKITTVLCASLIIKTAIALTGMDSNGISWIYTVKGNGAYIGNGQYQSAIPSSTTGIVRIPDKLGGYPVVGISGGAFWNCNELMSIELHDGIKSIGGYAFAGCVGLEAFHIPNSVESIGDYAFANCSSLKSIYIGAGLRELGVDAIGCSCDSLQTIYVSESNPYVKSVDGMVLSKDGSVLLTIPAGRTEIDIPSGVAEIGVAAFADYRRLERVTIPSSIRHIADYAFLFCESLVKVVIEGDAPEVGDAAFGFMGNTCVVYATAGAKGFGTEAPIEWNGMPVVFEGASGTDEPSKGGNVSVPRRWLVGRKHNKANGMAANGRKVWECYVMGLNPDEKDDNLRIKDFKMVNGKPLIKHTLASDIVGPLNWKVKVKGKVSLTDAEWSENLEGKKFFTVVVEK